MAEVDLFEWQLHIAIVVIVVDVLTPIVHGQILHHRDSSASLLMFKIVSNQNRNFQYLL